jgi:hypothetical protein
MPCYDPHGAVDDAHNSEAAELLCSLIRTLTKSTIPADWRAVFGSVKGLSQWWADHQDRDALYKRKGL